MSLPLWGWMLIVFGLLVVISVIILLAAMKHAAPHPDEMDTIDGEARKTIQQAVNERYHCEVEGEQYTDEIEDALNGRR
jgi:uncharacterized membrane protein